MKTRLVLIGVMLLSCCLFNVGVSGNDDIFLEVSVSSDTVYVGDEVTVTVTQVDQSEECDYSTMELTVSQTDSAQPIFLPEVYFEGSGVGYPVQAKFTAVTPGQIDFYAYAYGEIFCGYWMWEFLNSNSVTVSVIGPTPTPTPELTVTAGPSETPVMTATPTPGITITPTPTPECPETGVTISMTSEPIPGKPFLLEVEACNGTEENLEVDFYLMLDVMGMYYFYPSWTQELDSAIWSIPPCSCISHVILDFIWPKSEPCIEGIKFYAGLFKTDTFELIGKVFIAEIGC